MLSTNRLRARYRYIMSFFIGTILSLIWWEWIVPRFGLGTLVRRNRPSRLRQIAIRFRRMALRMGGVMIKVGQFLSARLDVLPPEITEELAGLQDEVPPEEFSAIRARAEQELGMPLESAYDAFDPVPLAAASLGQVHIARLREDAPEARRFRSVVVKVQRPFIEQYIAVDFSALRQVAGWLNAYEPIRRRVDVPALVNELDMTVAREIDYIAEGKNAERFRHNFARRRRVHVPRVAWSHTTGRVLTLENVLAIKVTDYEAITAAGISRHDVAVVLFDAYLRQIFEDEFFHADPHPGNLFVTPVPATAEHAATWRLTFVDFGMVGAVPEQLRQGLRDVLVAVGTRNANKLVRAFQTLGILLPSTDLQLLERAEAQLFDRFWGMSMGEMTRVTPREIRNVAYQFRDLMYEMPFQFPHDLLLLGRTMAILSGICTGIDPEFNMWDRVAPYARRLIQDEAGSSWRVVLDEVSVVARELVALPGQASRVLTALERGELNVNMPGMNRQIFHLESALNRLVGAAVFSSFLFGGVILYRGGDTFLGISFWILAAIALVYLILLSRGHSPWRRDE